MKKYLGINNILASLPFQILVIIATFVIISTTSYLFSRSIEHRHITNDTENALTIAENEITSFLNVYEMLLYRYSEIIKIMISNGESEDKVTSYITDITNVMFKDENQINTFAGIEVYFFLWGGKYISGNNSITHESFLPQDQTWYKEAVEADGKIAITNPQINTTTEETLIKISGYIYDENHKPLGIICFNTRFDKLISSLKINLTKNSYCFLLNNRLEFIYHPIQYYVNKSIYNSGSELKDITHDLEMGRNVNNRKTRNFQKMNSTVFIRRIKYDWYLGIIIPINEYNKNINLMALLISALGVIMASILCLMMYHISKAKIKSDIRTQQKSNFLATMSHEIRTPLNAILGMTEIEMQNLSHPPAASEAFLKINNSGNFLLGIINDILDLSKIESGNIELLSVKYDVASLVNDIVQLNYIRYESKPVEFILEVNENIPSILIGDELRIKQVLNNLLSNAFKYTDSGEVVLSISAECVGRGSTILVTLVFNIRDTGQGMSQEQIKKLFDEYSRFNLEANRSTIGTGLGMTITRNLIELMYGNISIKSTVGEGTHITVRLPQKTDGVGIKSFIGKEMAENLRHFKQGFSTQQKKSQIIREYMPYGSVLIVDDVETNLYVARGLMVPYGLRMETAVSGFEAVNKVKNGNVYDIIFMDHMMPKMDGIETTRLLREMNYMHPIVALTANALTGQAEIFESCGFDGFISKPIDIRHLNIILNTLIRDKQPDEVIEAAQKAKIEIDKKQGVDHGHQQVDSQLAEIFSRDAEKAAVILENCIKSDLRTDNDIQMFIINIHAMKSALANVGKHELSALALRLEQAGRDRDINVLLSESGDFLKKLSIVIKEIKPKTEDNKDQADTEDTLLYLKEKLTIIKKACDEFDKKTVKNTLNELREKIWSNSKKELINIMSEHLLHSEFENVAVIANEAIKQMSE
jgi:signal transduction histidine kinase/DNA-binding response OmpR family regulator/HPt (histidine-containing phosphotransfer) domain-containing protein